MKLYKTFFLLIATVNIWGCKEVTESIKTDSNGKAGEILVVIDDQRWKGPIGDTIFNVLSAPFEILPQNEPFFRTMHVKPTAFKDIMTKHRNILIVNIGKDYDKTQLKEVTDKWANNQLVLQINAPDDSSFVAYWSTHKKYVVNEFFNKDITRLQQSYASYINKDASDQIKKLYNISLLLPTDYKIDVHKDHFAWISKETQSTSQGIFIYDYPYISDQQLQPDKLVLKRDAITQENVPGPDKGTYMQTEKRIPCNVENIELNGQQVILIRGLWYIENYFMGGPFESYTFVDKKRNRIVTIEGYVFAGKLDKKIYMWQLESILKTSKIVD